MNKDRETRLKEEMILAEKIHSSAKLAYDIACNKLTNKEQHEALENYNKAAKNLEDTRTKYICFCNEPTIPKNIGLSSQEAIITIKNRLT